MAKLTQSKKSLIEERNAGLLWGIVVVIAGLLSFYIISGFMGYFLVVIFGLFAWGLFGSVSKTNTKLSKLT